MELAVYPYDEMVGWPSDDPEQPLYMAGLTPEEARDEIVDLWKEVSDYGVSTDIAEQAYLVSLIIARRRNAQAHRDATSTATVGFLHPSSIRVTTAAQTLDEYVDNRLKNMKDIE